MKQKNLRRIVAGGTTATLVAGFAAVLSMGTASAFSVNHSGDIGGRWNIDRTIENVPATSAASPEITSRIKVRASLNTGDWRIPTTTAIKDIHHTCLSYVPNSGKVNGKNPGIDSQPDYVRMTGSWIGSSISYEVQYDISEACPIGENLVSSVHVSANQGFDTAPGNVGPAFQVTKMATATELSATPGPVAEAATTLTATISKNASGTVEFYNNDTLLGTADASSGQATYSWTPLTAQGGQPYSITARYLGSSLATDSTSEPLTGTVAAAPTAPAAPTGLSLSSNSVTVGDEVSISGQAEAGSSVEVTAGTQTCTAAAGEDGAFSCVITPDTAGDIAVTAIATNGVGPSAPSEALTLTVNPAVVIPGSPEMTVSPDTVTAGDDVTITVTTDEGNEVVITAGGTPIHTATAGTDGTVTTTHATTVVGSIEFTATASNTAGTSTPATKTVTVEKKIVTPAAPELTVSPETVVEGQDVTITVTTDEGNEVVITAGGTPIHTATAGTDGTVTTTHATTVVGSIEFTATASNTAGTSTPATKTVTVEKKIVTPEAPALTVSKDTVTTGDTVTVTAVTEAGNTLVITADGVEIFKTESTTGTVDFALITAGTVTFSATASNTAGISPATSKTVTVDALPAGEVKISLNPASPTAGQKVEVSVTGGDDGTDFTITSGDITLCEGTVDADGNGTCEWTATEGEHTLTAKVTVNGNDAVDTHTVTVAPAESTGGGNAGGDGGTGSLGSLGNLFGSLR